MLSRQRYRVLPDLRWLLCAFVFASSTILLAAAPLDDEGVTFFETKIRPVLVERCYKCHSDQAKELEAGLRLDTREGARAGGDSGPAVVPGDASSSLLLAAVRHDGLEMPPDAKLPDGDIANIERWIRMGAPDPRDGPATMLKQSIDPSKAREFWSFRPIEDAALPTVLNSDWPQTSVDFFVLATLELNGLQPSPEADRLDLIRRVTFDLLGLPPTTQQLDQFLQDPAPDAYERLVDRLLASPRYGERWGQHWLDVVRFAETEGFEYDRQIAGAWRYRDYVIRAFNSDLPYDEFVRQQIAGDELDATNHELLIAAGFHRLGAVRRNAGNQEVAGSRNEVLTERADVVGAAILGLTISCARCHDHKFDPVSQRDYYGLQAYFAASQEYELPMVDDDQRMRWEEQTAVIQKEISKLKNLLEGQTEDAESATLAKMDALEKKLPPPMSVISTVRNEFDKETPIHVLRRGEWSLPGERVSPSPPDVLRSSEFRDSAASQSSPRIALAQWLTDSTNPLTPRVISNRVWQYHFGRGIVPTTNDLGKNGQRPSHPELLDHLATRLMQFGWQLKPFHRLILLSSTYRQASATTVPEQAQLVDPDNALLWRFNKRRLSAEEIRDSMLAVSGELNLAVGGPSIMLPVDQQLVQQLYKPSQWEVSADPSEHARRSVYLIAKRNLRLPFMEVFDQPTLQTSCARREESTHAPQALELLNGLTSNQMTEACAARWQREAGPGIDPQIELAFRLATGRPPSPSERQLAKQFLIDGSQREFALAVFNLNAFLYVR